MQCSERRRCVFVCRSRNSVLSSENSPHSEDILCPIYFTCVCVCYYKLVLFLSLSECAGKLVRFASSHVWSDVWVAMFVMGVRSFCLFFLPVSLIRLMSLLSLIHSAFCIFFIFNLGCFSSVCVCV